MILSNSYAIWLIPSADQFVQLQNLINTICKQLGSPTFYPHLTIISGIAIIDTAPIDRIVEKFCILDFVVNGLGMEQDFYRSLYLDLKSNEVLGEMRLRLLREYSMTLKKYYPHISLLYGNYIVLQKEQLRSLIENAVPAQINCDRIQLWNTAGPVQEWRLIYEKQLAVI